MREESFRQSIERAASRLEALQQGSVQHAVPRQPEGPALEEFQSALEELRVADEELRQQADELAASRNMLEMQRQRYHDLFQFAPEPYLVTDQQGIILEANQAACELLQMAPAALLRYPLANHIAEDARREFRRRLNDVAEGGHMRNWPARILRRVTPDPAPSDEHETVVPVSITAAAGHDHSGKIIRWVIWDVTERCRVDEQLRSAREDLELRVQERTAELAAANEMLKAEVEERARSEAALARRTQELAESNAELQNFAYIASHDLKEPLRGISNYARFVAEDYADRLDDEGRNKLETLGRLARRMYALLDALLEYSRVGRTELMLRPVAVAHCLADTLSRLQPRLDEEDARLIVASELPTIRCDPGRTSQLLQELIVNAIKYNEAPQKVIEIGETAEKTDGEAGHDDWPVLFVRDNGIGIPERHHESVFRMFKRMHGRDTYGGGTGAGLALAKRIVVRHGGKVWIESARGEGATVYFTLGPRVEGADLA